MRRAMTVAGIVTEPAGQQQQRTASDLDEAASTNSVTSEAASSVAQERIILVAHILPLHAQRRADNLGWTFFWDEDSLLLQLRRGLPADTEVLYIGCLKEEVEVSEQDEVAANLLDNFNCVPAFFDADLRQRFYLGFCKQQLWPLFHYMLPLTPDHGGRFDRSLWQAYVSVNKVFADKVMEVINPDDDYVWVHDYHLMVLPTFLRKRFNRVRLGFFLHSPFPSSEIYRILPVRDEILRALLNSDLIGFHTFDYARHFLSCCSRMLGLEFESKRGYIGLEYYGRTVGIKIMPVGIHMAQLEDRLRLPDTKWRIGELRAQLQGKIVMLGVDDMDIFKGIDLKLLAMEQLLKQHPEWKGKLILVQVANPARGRGKDVQELEEEVKQIADRINRDFGFPGYEPVMLLGRHVPLYERIAFYTVAECCVVTAVRDGMNLIPYEYIVCREAASSVLDASTPGAPTDLKKSMLIVSEFIGCSPSLSGAIRVNPWNIEAVAEAMNMAVTMPEPEKHMRHEKHFKFVKDRDVDYWASSFIADLSRTCQDHARRRCYGIGFGLGFRVVALDPNFRKLLTEQIVAAYRKSKSRVLLLDYDGTMKPQSSLQREPTPEVLAVLNTLCNDPKNVVFIVSGRARRELDPWFSACPRLGIAAEHGYLYRWHGDEEWSTSVTVSDFEWQEIARPIMYLYRDSTDGSYVEEKESAYVWNHRDADPDFGSWQAKELIDHLESVLANEPVVVKSGQHIVEVKPQGVSKGVIVERLLSLMNERGEPADFLLCIGDDRSDEDMFESIDSHMALRPHSSIAEVFACTVGNKPSKAKYFMDDTVEVVKMLQALAGASELSSVSSQVKVSSLRKQEARS